MLNFSSSLSALRANAVALEVVAHNIANANTEGYARQEVLFSERPSVSRYGHMVGQGVNVDDIRSTASLFTEKAINQNTSTSAGVAAQLDVLTDIETLLNPVTGSLTDRIKNFFEEMERLTATPDDAGARTGVIQAAKAFAEETSSVATQLIEIRNSIDLQIQSSLDNIKELSTELIRLNKQITVAQARGSTPLELINNRSVVLNELSREIDVEIVQPTGNNGSRSVSFRLVDAQVGFGSNPLELFALPIGDEIAILRPGAPGPLNIESGRLGGLIEARNAIVPEYIEQIDAFTATFVSAVDASHATGVGVRGGMTEVRGSRVVGDANQPLGQLDTFTPVKSGSLYITVTNPADQTRSLHEVVIDPSNSLIEVAVAISNVDHIQGFVDTNTGRLSILAEPGFTFDFTGGVPTAGTTNNISGTTESRFSGFTGDEDREFDFRFVGTGTIGVTEGLSLEVYDESGLLVGTHQVGRGYSPGSKLAIGQGINVEVASGTVNDGDSFSSIAVAQSDTSGILVALGINALFSGQNAAELGINEDIIRNPTLLAMTKSGNPLDTRNVQSMLSLRESGTLVDGTQSFEVFLANTTALVGAQVNGLSQTQDGLEIVNQSLRDEWRSVAGVDENEEIVHMLQYQRAFQSAARYVSAVDEALQELFDILR